MKIPLFRPNILRTLHIGHEFTFRLFVFYLFVLFVLFIYYIFCWGVRFALRMGSVKHFSRNPEHAQDKLKITGKDLLSHIVSKVKKIFSEEESVLHALLF